MPWEPPPIQTFYPIEFLREQEHGRNKPLVIRCECDDENKDFVVKLWGSVELGRDSLAKEIYGSLLANFFRIETPNFALVDIDIDFADIQPDPAIKARLQNSLGLNFGSEFIPGALMFNPPASNALIALAARVFCFDMLIGNVDRKMPKINLFRKGDSLVVFDHELAFPFSRPATYIGGLPPAWECVKEPWAKDHILYNSLKGKDVGRELDQFFDDFLIFEDENLDKIEAQIPGEWRNDVTQISTYLIEARDNVARLKRSLQELLA